NYIVVPAMVGIVTLATPITSVLFQRGAFGHHEVALTAQALSAFALGLWSVSMVRLIVPAFYAVRDTRSPVLAATCGFVANAGFSLLLMGAVPTTGASRAADAIAALTQSVALVDLRHTGLALATSLSATVNFVVLAMLLR